MPHRRAKRPPPDFVELSQFEVHPKAVRRIPERYCHEHHCVVLGPLPPDDKTLVPVGVLEPGDKALLAEIAEVLGHPVRPVLLPQHEIERALERGFRGSDAPPQAGLAELKPVESLTLRRAPVDVILDEILGSAVRRRASDIHIECYDGDVDVRFRIDGVLHQVQSALSPDNLRQAISRLKVFARLDIAEWRRAQDGSVRATYKDARATRVVEFRVNVLPGPFGEDAVLRVLDGGARVLDLSALGLAGARREQFDRLLHNPEGMLVVSGPTGSGKTTTIYAALQLLRDASRKILTVEDPIEQLFAKVNQKQVGATMGFADHVRAFMRQNPDVIVVGEVRDPETAGIAARAAQTGHLVLTTVHAADSVRVLTRLARLDLDPDLVASVLVGSLSQRLVRRLCSACRELAPPTDHQRSVLRLAEREPVHRARGCAECDGTGYRGRVGVYELFVPDDAAADAIARGEPVHVLRAQARRAGMQTLVEDAVDKARQGLTSLDEIVRVVPLRMLAEERRPA